MWRCSRQGWSLVTRERETSWSSSLLHAWWPLLLLHRTWVHLNAVAGPSSKWGKREGERKRERGREASFTEHNVSKMHPPVVCFGTLFLFVAELYFIVQMDHILFIHSSVDGQLGCLLVLVIVNSGAIFIYFSHSKFSCLQYFLLIQIKLLWTFMHISSMDVLFHFSWEISKSEMSR